MQSSRAGGAFLTTAANLDIWTSKSGQVGYKSALGTNHEVACATSRGRAPRGVPARNSCGRAATGSIASLAVFDEIGEHAHAVERRRRGAAAARSSSSDIHTVSKMPSPLLSAGKAWQSMRSAAVDRPGADSRSGAPTSRR